MDSLSTDDSNRANLESSAGMSDQMSSCNSDYAPSSNSGNSSSGNFTDDWIEIKLSFGGQIRENVVINAKISLFWHLTEV